MVKVWFGSRHLVAQIAAVDIRRDKVTSRWDAVGTAADEAKDVGCGGWCPVADGRLPDLYENSGLIARIIAVPWKYSFDR